MQKLVFNLITVFFGTVNNNNLPKYIPALVMIPRPLPGPNVRMSKPPGVGGSGTKGRAEGAHSTGVGCSDLPGHGHLSVR